MNEISEDEAATLATKAEQLLSVLNSVKREPHPVFNHFPSVFEPALPSLGVVDMAKSKGYTMWSDDRVLRRIAASMGVPTFGTLAFVDALLNEAKLDGAEHTVCVAHLLANYYLDVPFTPDVYELASQLDGRHPGGAAHGLSRAGTWADPETTFAFVLAKLGELGAADPQDVRVWCRYTATGLLAVASGDAEACSNNLSILLNRCMNEAWCTPAALPFVLEGIRDAMRACVTGPLRDPLEVVLRSVHQVAASQLGDARAKSYLLGLVAQCGDGDKLTAARVILTAPRG